MPNWKKVITSGSNAELNQITASAGIKGTLDTAAQGNITSLGTLTTLTVDDITINGSRISDAGDLTIDAGGDILIDADGGDIFFMDNGTTRLAFDTTQGHITASGNISASGGITGSHIHSSGNIKGNIVVTDEIQGLTQGANVALNLNTSGDLGITVANNKKFFFNEGANDGTSFTIQNSSEDETFSVNSDDGAINTSSHITASGDISSSGTITANQYDVTSGVQGFSYSTSTDTLFLGADNDIQKISYGKTGGTSVNGHSFVGNITASGNISASGNCNFKNGTAHGNFNVVANLNAFGNIIGDNSTDISGIDDITTLGNSSFGNAITDRHTFNGHITASGNISASGTIFGNALNLTGSGNIYGSGSYVTLQNDGTKPSELRLNCEANTHYIGIRGPEHSGASNYVLKLPNGAPSDNQILKVDGSPSNGEVTLAWESDGGGGGVSFPTTEVVSSSNALFIGKTNGAFVSASTGNVQISGSGRGQLEVDYRLFDTGSSHLSSAGGGVGDIVKFGGSATQAGDIYYLKTNGTWDEAQANAVGTSTGSLAVALGSNSTTDGMLLKGMVKLHNDPSATIGNPVFLDDTTAGHARNDAPDTSGDIVRIVGHYYSGSGLIYFNPDNTFIEVA